MKLRLVEIVNNNYKNKLINFKFIIKSKYPY